MSSAISGVGTKFRRWSGTAWADIAEVKSISGPGMSRETIDVTSLDSGDGYREFIGSFRDAGTLNLSMNYTPAGYALMKTDFESSDLQNYEILLPDTENTSLEFEGLVTELPLNITTDDVITMDVVIKISGSVEKDSGSGS